MYNPTNQRLLMLNLSLPNYAHSGVATKLIATLGLLCARALKRTSTPCLHLTVVCLCVGRTLMTCSTHPTCAPEHLQCVLLHSLLRAWCVMRTFSERHLQVANRCSCHHAWLMRVQKSRSPGFQNRLDWSTARGHERSPHR